MNLLKRILYVLIISIILILVNITIVNAKTVEITTETLNLRKEASTESNIVAQISIGEECEVLGEEGDWYKVKYKDYTGYISKEYTKVIGGNEEETSNEGTTTGENDTSLTEKTEEQQNETENVSNTTDKNSNQGKLNKKSDIKIVPLINSSNIDTLDKEEKVTIINEINGWLYIQTDTISGWIRTENITIQKANNNDDNKENNSDDSKTDTTKEDNNSSSTDDKDTSDNENNANTFEEKTMYATDYVNIRKEPSTSADKLMVVSTNTALKVIGEEGNWYKVSTSAGNAYVSKDVVSDKKVTVTNRGDVDRAETTTNSQTSKKETTTSTSKEEENTASSINTSEIVSYAKKFLGVPYVYGGASASGFDCSGFTMYVYKHFGISMRHGAQAQAKLGEAIKTDKSSKSSLLNSLKAGDLVFFLDYETMDEIGHCGIYIGNGNFIHASSGSGYCVKINSLLPGEYYNTRYCAARRVI